MVTNCVAIPKAPQPKRITVRIDSLLVRLMINVITRKPIMYKSSITSEWPNVEISNFSEHASTFFRAMAYFVTFIDISSSMWRIWQIVARPVGNWFEYVVILSTISGKNMYNPWHDPKSPHYKEQDDALKFEQADGVREVWLNLLGLKKWGLR